MKCVSVFCENELDFDSLIELCDECLCEMSEEYLNEDWYANEWRSFNPSLEEQQIAENNIQRWLDKYA